MRCEMVQAMLRSESDGVDDGTCHRLRGALLAKEIRLQPFLSAVVCTEMQRSTQTRTNLHVAATTGSTRLSSKHCMHAAASFRALIQSR